MNYIALIVVQCVYVNLFDILLSRYILDILERDYNIIYNTVYNINIIYII